MIEFYVTCRAKGEDLDTLGLAKIVVRKRIVKGYNLTSLSKQYGMDLVYHKEGSSYSITHKKSGLLIVNARKLSTAKTRLNTIFGKMQDPKKEVKRLIKQFYKSIDKKDLEEVKEMEETK